MVGYRGRGKKIGVEEFGRPWLTLVLDYQSAKLELRTNCSPEVIDRVVIPFDVMMRFVSFIRYNSRIRFRPRHF